ncbi:MAG TPA: hypothetical protein VMP01_23065 [Pirellulaceae bacterium]|nr:hypothetical protein [Pirellulaceae bacterium]
MNVQLDDLVDRKRIVAIDATPIPAPPNSPHPGEHLFVNCHYDVSQAKRPLHELASDARGDALQIVRRLGANPIVQAYVSAVVTVYGHFPVHGAARPARRRIYRVGVLAKDLPANGTLLGPDFFSRFGVDESSELDDIIAGHTESIT